MNTEYLMFGGNGLHWINILIALALLWAIFHLFAGIFISRKDRKTGMSDKSFATKNHTARYKAAGLSENDITIFRDTMSEAKKNILAWENNMKKNEDLEMVESVTKGLESAKSTFKYIVSNPNQLTKQNDFLYKDLPNMVKLTEKYLEMKAQSVKFDQAKRDMDETLLLIKTLSGQIAKNYHEILMEDVKIIKNEVNYGE